MSRIRHARCFNWILPSLWTPPASDCFWNAFDATICARVDSRNDGSFIHHVTICGIANDPARYVPLPWLGPWTFIEKGELVVGVTDTMTGYRPVKEVLVFIYLFNPKEVLFFDYEDKVKVNRGKECHAITHRTISESLFNQKLPKVRTKVLFKSLKKFFTDKKFK